MNPILKKEIKTKMRSWKFVGIMTLYLAILICFIVFLSPEIVFTDRDYGINPALARRIFIAISAAQLMLIIGITPATTCSSISGERERGTLDLLICTRLSSMSIILGKLMSSIAEILLLLVASIPILSIIFLFGSVSPGNILLIFSFYVVTAILFGSVGIFTSTFFKKTTTSTIISYIISGVIVLLPYVIVVFMMIFYYGPKGINQLKSMPIPLYFSPITGLSTILAKIADSTKLIRDLVNIQNVNLVSVLLINILISLLMSGILLYVSSVKINPMKKIGLKRSTNTEGGI
ncbi:ABC-2 family transporter protein [Gottschalkia purinilytica]|uniref:ABC-2 family transporter protein n=1 Tax=Gottschalkia purinilytica TaxID=1503 RepID=A0A0L0W9M9_GOTPU|nr:ABC transporter permease subunit [Gottschalkia purinilytica]KNF08152.1 ABC-2 family transporter protein [Gottschalkia purinilytica]